MRSLTKVVLSSVLCLCICVASLPFASFTVFAQAEGDYEYTIADGEATIVRYLGHDEDVTVPSLLGGYPVTTVGRDAFNNNSTIINVSLPNGITSIQESAFASCENLSSVQLPDTLISIEMATFLGCALTSMVIPDSVKTIGGGVFASCAQLTKITIPNSVMDMGEEIFSNCNSLVNIVIPDSITTIARAAFMG